MVIFIKSRVAMETLPQKGDGEQTSEYNTECMLFEYTTKDMKLT